MPVNLERLTKPQALADARAATESHCTSKIVSIHLAEEQGMFSRTFMVVLEDRSNIIVQLKDNEIDLTKVALARALLGNIVPSMHAAKTKKAHFAYISEIIAGQIWAVKDDSGQLSGEQAVHLASQTGRSIAKCSLGFNHVTSGIVEYNIVPRLHKILEKEDSLSFEARSRIEILLKKTDELKTLPLALCHVDLNARNIIVNDSAEIVGLIDWEQAALLPLGMNAWCIRYLSVNTIRGVDHVNEETLPMAQAFWTTLTADVPPNLQPAILTAMQVGYILISVFIEGITPSEMVLSNLVTRFDWLENTFRPFCSA